jgi:hypothetical protein
MVIINTTENLEKQFKKLSTEIECQIGNITADELLKLIEAQKTLVETMAI